MKITLTKNIELHSATVYMKIKKNVKRIDIQDYLKGKRFNDKLLNNRINDYLIEIGVYDTNKQLTRLGYEVKETGLLPTPEEGKYKIWYTDDDTYFGSIVMYFRREKANEYSTIDDPINFPSNGHFIVPAKEKDSHIDYAEFVLTNNTLKCKKFDKTESITAILIIETDKPTFCFFDGNIGKEGMTKLDRQKPIKREEKIESVIRDILPNWDEKYQRMRVRFNNNDSFEINDFSCKWSDFDGTIDSIKIMPYDMANAKQWRDYLLMQKVKKDYVSGTDFDKLVVETNGEDGFEAYTNKFDSPKIDSFKTKTEQFSAEFWHLNAPNDLSI